MTKEFRCPACNWMFDNRLIEEAGIEVAIAAIEEEIIKRQYVLDVLLKYKNKQESLDSVEQKA